MTIRYKVNWINLQPYSRSTSWGKDCSSIHTIHRTYQHQRII